jgi:hypothetical protein
VKEVKMMMRMVEYNSNKIRTLKKTFVDVARCERQRGCLVNADTPPIPLPPQPINSSRLQESSVSSKDSEIHIPPVLAAAPEHDSLIYFCLI